MFRRLTGLIQTFGHQKIYFSSDDPKVAATALMLYLVRADGAEKKSETQSLSQLLAAQYGIDGDILVALIKAGQTKCHETADILSLAKQVKDGFGRKELIDFIRFLWEIAFADGEILELEDSLIGRIAQMLGLDAQEQEEIKQLVALKYQGS